MSLAEILQEIPHLTQAEKEQLSRFLDEELQTRDEHSEVISGIRRGLESLQRGERTYTIEEARERVKSVAFRARR
jgi:hypothetical protein